MSFWVYVISSKGEIVAAADTRITWTNEAGQNIGSTEDGLKILDISNKHSKAFILVTGYKFWHDGFENNVVSYLNSIPEHTASDIAEYLTNFPFKGNCFLGLICSSQVTRASCYNLVVSGRKGHIPFFSRKSTGDIINKDTTNEFYFADSSSFINNRSDLNLLSSLNFIPFGESFTERAKAVLHNVVKSYSNPLINHMEISTKDGVPFYPGPFNRQPVANTVKGVPANFVDTESAL